VHSAEDLLARGGERLFELVLSVKANGAATKIGVSVYSPEQAHEVVDRYSIDLIQIPMSVLDQRMLTSGVLAELAGKGIEVHVRSAFLQGVIVAEPREIPEPLARLRPYVERIRTVAKNSAMTPAGLALAYLRSLEAVHRIIVGVNDGAQLEVNLAAYQEGLPSELDFRQFECTEEALIDPRQWSIQAR
jgi:aryl-alcohol dehydrogenase-like predicted oxidoreductase